MPERIQKILSQWGIASRRQAEQMILAGRVCCNGRRVSLGDKAEPECDRLTVDGQLLTTQNRPELLYILLNKPRGVMSTCHDPQNRRTVIGCLPAQWQEGYGLHPVGRLDADSTGAILITNDGDLTLKLTHPRYHLPKTYEVWVAGQPSASTIQTWQRGIMLDGRKTRRAQVTVLKQQPDRALLKIVMGEGRNRQIRRVAEHLGHPVLRLHRTAIGALQLRSRDRAPLKTGEYCFLSRAFLEQVFQLPTSWDSDPSVLNDVAENVVCEPQMIS